MIENLLSNKNEFNYDKPYTLIIGSNPSKGARSPLLWNNAFNQLNLNLKMYPADVSLINIEPLINYLLKDKYFLGGAIAVPYKEKITDIFKKNKFCKLTQEAENIGAINCIYRDNNQLIGTNTDGEAALITINKFLNPLSKKFIVFGFGGVGKSIVAYLKKFYKDAKIIISVRNKERFKKIEKLKDLEFINWPLENFNYKNTDAIINCTILGSKNVDMNTGQKLLNEIPLKDIHLSFESIINSINPNILYFDAIYDPLETKLTKLLKKRNFKCVNGLDMNLEQAVIAFNYVMHNKHKLDEIKNAMNK